MSFCRIYIAPAFDNKNPFGFIYRKVLYIYIENVKSLNYLHLSPKVNNEMTGFK